MKRSKPTGRTLRRLLVALPLTLAVVLVAHTLVARPANLGGGGPDVTVFTLNGTNNYGSENGIRGYSVGTTSCNRGQDPLWWCDNTRSYCSDEQHPVIAQNIYRLKEGRFEQIGMSWLKHGFLSTNSFNSDCGDCAIPPRGGDQLGVGCTDAYSAGLNGSRPLGKRSEVDARTGGFDFPIVPTSTSAVFDQRVKVLESDVDPAANAGARYWVEGHYIAEDDALAGNGLNNASYREVSVSAGSLNLNFIGGTVEGDPALFAWQAADPEVRMVNVDIDVAGVVERFHVAQRASSIPGGTHFEYAVHNLNSDRAARSFEVAFPTPTTISNVGFSGIAHHSGEPYAETPWPHDLSNPNGVKWSTQAFSTNPDANALRWGTVFSFWFDTTTGATPLPDVTLSLFKPGDPTEVNFQVVESFFDDGFETGSTGAWDQACPPNC